MTKPSEGNNICTVSMISAKHTAAAPAFANVEIPFEALIYKVFVQMGETTLQRRSDLIADIHTPTCSAFTGDRIREESDIRA